MTVKTSKNNLCVNKIVGQKTEKIIAEGDEIVPDIKPDILSTVSTNGNVCIYRKEIQEGKLKIEGGVNAYIIYIADDEKSSIRAINTNIEFSKTIEIKELTSSMNVECIVNLLSIDCKIINGRKINLRANMEVSITVYSKENIEYIDKIEDCRDVQLLKQNIVINTLVGSGNTRIYAKDTVNIENIDNLAEIMRASVTIENKESKISYNKVLSKADTVFKIMYLTEDNRINTITANIPIMGFIDIQDVAEDDISDLTYEIKNIIVKPNNVEEHSIYLEAEIEVQGFVYKKQTINMIEDLYSKTEELSFTQKNVKLMLEKTSFKQEYVLRKQENIEVANCKIYDVEVNPVILSTQIEDGRIIYKGDVNLGFLYAKADTSSIAVKNIVEPFEYTASIPQVTSKSKINTQIEISKKDFVVMPDGTIDTNMSFNFDVNLVKESNINIIENITEEEGKTKETYSIVIYYTKTGDTLWNIAKRFGSTVDEIAKVNNIDKTENVMQGQQLFIPR